MTWTIGDPVTTKMGSMKGEKGTVKEVKRNNSGYGDPFITDVYVEWDSGGFSWISPRSLVRVE